MAAAQGETAYEQAIRDEGFRATVSAFYTGNYRALDALWWLSHPTQPAPSGQIAPATQLRDLQHQLFSEHGGGPTGPESASRLPQLEAEITYERQAIEHAVAAARAAPADRAAPVDRAGLDGAIETADADARPSDSAQIQAGDDGAQPASSPPFWERPSRGTVIGLGIAAALIVGVGIGTNLGQGDADASPAAQPTASATPRATESGIAALDIFDREQTPQDIPTQFMPETLNHDSFRVLRDTGSDGYFPLAYAVRSSSGMACLLVTQTQVDYVVTCVRDSEFPSQGIRLQAMTELVFPGSTGAALPTDLTIVWAADGTVQMMGSSRQTPEAALEPTLEPTLEPAG